jgi:hypothetical protein
MSKLINFILGIGCIAGMTTCRSGSPKNSFCRQQQFGDILLKWCLPKDWEKRVWVDERESLRTGTFPKQCCIAFSHPVLFYADTSLCNHLCVEMILLKDSSTINALKANQLYTDKLAGRYNPLTTRLVSLVQQNSSKYLLTYEATVDGNHIRILHLRELMLNNLLCDAVYEYQRIGNEPESEDKIGLEILATFNATKMSTN